ncbi:hypothetical protein MFIFM68171_08158 [Madurella fahalii]|uniref:Peptidase M43 pregnancy-associated plasma-A domain-containing protein n=1 Tax=Madurella fahalii TaxID=1157608 RepID=A0ABQ0GJK4_9PEZI
MYFRQLVAGLLAASPALAQEVHKCGGHNELAELQAQVGNLGSRLRSLRARQDYPVPPTVDLVVHVTAPSTRREDGYLSKAEVAEQVRIIKELYGPTKLTFNYDETKLHYHVDSRWQGEKTTISQFNPILEEYHIGDYRTLNLYFYNNTHQGYGGGCRNPWTEAQKGVPPETRLKQDGCVISTYTINGSSHPFMNRGKTAVHEIGHWFGLFHPFEDGGIQATPISPPDTCWAGNPDDHVVDTPKTRQGVSGSCDNTSNTCNRNAEGDNPILDPIENYMMYTSDDCQSRFTEGQIKRMYQIYHDYRVNATMSG